MTRVGLLRSFHGFPRWPKFCFQFRILRQKLRYENSVNYKSLSSWDDWAIFLCQREIECRIINLFHYFLQMWCILHDNMYNMFLKDKRIGKRLIDTFDIFFFILIRSIYNLLHTDNIIYNICNCDTFQLVILFENEKDL